MIKDGKILLGKADDLEVFMRPEMMNRHGLIAGASGTGKTVTLKVIAESLSELGVPTFIADVKGDLSGMIVPGDQAGVQERLDSMGESFEVRKFPVHFFDVYREKGHPVRAVVEEMDPVLLSRILSLTEAQRGVLNIIFKAAEEMDLDIIDLKDLQAMTSYVGEHSKDYTVKYGNVSKQSVGAIQRKLLELESQEGDLLFGMPAVSIDDFLAAEGGMGVMNIMECQKLFLHPMLYATFLLWLLDKLYREMPEVGDLDKPKIVFFFDEAHLLFDDAPKELMDRIEQMVKLIRSKGVGIFFCTQSPTDIPDAVLAQLSNRIQHALRAYTPKEIKAVEKAAESFRVNPDLDTSETITSMKTGQALVSVLDEEGAPTMVQKTKIMPPQSSMNIADDDSIRRCIETDSIYGKYEKDIDPESAYEKMDDIYAEEAELEAQEEEARRQAKLEEQKAKEEAKAAAKKAEENDWAARLSKKAKRRAENELVNFGVRSAKKFLKNLLK